MRYKGYGGKILRVNLTSSEIEEQPLTDELVERWIGGAGFCSYILYRELDASTQPLGASNKLMLATGPFTGTLWPQGNRYTVAAKSPLTDAWGEAHSAGSWAPELKYAGYDALIIEGKAGQPSLLVIDDDEVAIEDASHLWGKDTAETDDMIRKDLGEGFKVASIGQAGEKLVLLSCIMNDRDRAAARSGLGAVMGSKKLKAIAVRGTRGLEVYDTDGYLSVMKALQDKMLADPLTEGRVRYGTTSLVDLMNEIGRLPSYNMRTGVFKYAAELGCERIRYHYLIKPRADFACTQRCARFTKVAGGPYACLCSGPEFETLSALGSRCGNRNLESVIYGHHLCNLYGMDTIGVGGTISWAMECYEQGLLTKKQTDGLELAWGAHETIIALVHKIARREGFGDMLASGSYRAAEKLGVGKRYVMHVKKQEIAGQDGRAQKSMGLSMAVAPRGADHLYAFPVLDEGGFEDRIKEVYGARYLPEMADKLSPVHKAYMVFVNENFSVLVESLGACKYGTMIPPALYYDEVHAALKPTTGLGHGIADLKHIGERIVNLNRMFNVREGMSRLDDMLPKRFVEEPAPEGPPKGQVVELDHMLDEYYELRDWDENGIPRLGKLRALGLDFAVRG